VCESSTLRNAATTDEKKETVRAELRSAVTHDGLEYRLDEGMRVRTSGWQEAHLTGWADDHAVHLFVSESRPEKPNEARVSHLASEDARRFGSPTAVRIRGLRRACDVVSDGKSLRLYGLAENGLQVWSSRDGRNWKDESGLRLPRVTDAAVARLKGGQYVMLYCVEADSTPRREMELAWADAPWTSDDRLDATEESVDAQASGADGAAGTSDAQTTADARPEPAGAEATRSSESAHRDIDSARSHEAGVGVSDAADWQPFAEAPAEADLVAAQDWAPQELAAEEIAQPDGVGESSDAAEDRSQAMGAEEQATGHGPDLAESENRRERPALLRERDEDERLSSDSESEAAQFDGGLFPPKPDFVNKVDYNAWYRSVAWDRVSDNAYLAYRSFMPHPGDQPGDKPQWPEFSAMLNDTGFTGPPGPWDPAEHPDWDASIDATRDVIEQFRAAAEHTGYAHPVDISPQSIEETPGKEPLLIGIILPHLQPHKSLVKQMLSDAWRTENGRVSPEKMRDAWEVSLKNANLVKSGATLIEHLVGIAEQAVVEDHARWALKHGVFADEQQLESALNTLAENDRDDTDPTQWLSGEYGFTMQITQYLFTPSGPNGELRVDPERAKLVFGMTGGAEDEKRAKILALNGDDARAAADAFDGFYREASDQMRTGYPEVRAADLSAIERKYVSSSPLVGGILPSIARIQMIRARNEASRRATQLSYAVHLFKTREGRWPQTLDELPPEHGERMRTDPFTGGRFGYRLNADGPVIYTLSENGQDDGGVHSPRWNDSATPEQPSDDYVFWPPQAGK